MTLDEAQEIAAIIMTADSGCPFCATDLAEKMQDSFPAFIWKVNPSREYKSDFITVEQS